MPSLYDIESPRPRKMRARRAPGATSNPQRVRTLRMLAAQTEWLEGQLHWKGGRVAWKHSRGLLTPTAADLSAAQRTLYQVARFPHASDRAFGDGAAWLERRQSHLDYAKRLCLLHAPDLSSLARERSPQAISCLVELIAAEALCQGGLPVSPSQALVRATVFMPDLVVRLLQQSAGDESLPRPARALTFATLGAVTRCLVPRSKRAESWFTGTDSAFKEAYRWGARCGLPDAPGIALTILLDGGSELLERWQRAKNLAPDFVLPDDLLQVMLSTGTEPERVVELCESMVEPQRLYTRLKSHTVAELDEIETRFQLHPNLLYAWREDWRQRCQKYGSTLADAVHRTAVATADPEAPRLLAIFMGQMLDLQHSCTGYIMGLPGAPADRRQQQPKSGRQRLAPGQKRRARTGPSLRVEPALQQRDAVASLRTVEIFWEFALHVLREGELLPPSLLVPYLQLLVDESASFWKFESLVWGRKNRRPRERAQRLGRWLQNGCIGNVRPLVLLLKRSQNPEFCREVLHADVHVQLGRVRFKDKALYAYALQVTKLVQPFSSPWCARRVYNYLAHFATAHEARSALGSILEAIALLPREQRSDDLDDVLDSIGATRHSISSNLPRIGPHLKYLFEFLIRTRRTSHVFDAVEALLALDAEVQHRKRSMMAEAETGDIETNIESEYFEENEDPPLDYWLTWLLDETHMVQRERQAAKRPGKLWLGELTRICAQLANGNFERFQSGIRAVSQCNYGDWTEIQKGLDELRRYPRLREQLAQSLAVQPARILKLIERWAFVPCLGAEARHRLDVWRNDDANIDLPEEWREVVALAPPLALLATQYVWLRQICAEAARVPAGVRLALELPQKLQGELIHLEQLVLRNPERTALSKRAATLRSRIQDHDTLQAQAVQEARERLKDAVQEARLKAGERSLENCFRAQLESLVGRLPSELAMDDDWLNAVLLSVDIGFNRKLLRHLLRALANGDTTWRERLPGNVKFISELAERGVNVEAWNGTHRKRYSVTGLGNGWVHFCIEQDPLRILQMGNAFGTCLSVGGCNSFSTVANACEANKRVLFARDSAGRIVARKLMAMNAAGALVGFHSYVGGPNEEANARLRTIVARYAREFAAYCGLELADEGEVPRLFAEEWYDDGIVSWAEGEGKQPASASAVAPVYKPQQPLEARPL